MFRLSTRTHAILDIVHGLAFLAGPMLLRTATGAESFAREEGESAPLENYLLPAIGGGILAQGLLTDYELGLAKVISMPNHLYMDFGVGALLVTAPWLLPLERNTRIAMTGIGIATIAVSLLTKPQPDTWPHEEGEAIKSESAFFSPEV